jgi:two-component system OmpR family sensor kinase
MSMLRSISRTFSQRLYLRIWLAVVGGVAVLTLVVGWAWRTAAEQNALRIAPPAREVVLRDLQGRVVLQGTATRQPQHPSEGVLYQLQTTDGQTFELELEPRFPGRERMDRRERHERAAALRAPPPPQSLAFWTRPPFGFLWMLVLVGLAVALGVFPIIRRLMSRLEVLQRGVQRFGEGDLAARVPVQGHDEVADLSRQFNAAAGRIEALLRSHKSLLANASHELRSPLARIRMGMELMQDGAPSASARAEILRNIAELDQLVDEILLASRLDAREGRCGLVRGGGSGGVGRRGMRTHRRGAGCRQPAAGSACRGQAAAPRAAQPVGKRPPLQRWHRERQPAPARVAWQKCGCAIRGRACPQSCANASSNPSTACPAPASAPVAWAWAWPWCAPSQGATKAPVHCEGNPQGQGACFVLRLPITPLA